MNQYKNHSSHSLFNVSCEIHWQRHASVWRKENHLSPSSKNSTLYVSRETFNTAVPHWRKHAFRFLPNIGRRGCPMSHSPRPSACFCQCMFHVKHTTPLSYSGERCFYFLPALGDASPPNAVIHKKEQVSTENRHFSTGLHACKII